MKLFIYILLISITLLFSEEIDKNKILNILTQASGKKMKIKQKITKSANKNNQSKKSRNIYNNLPSGELPNLPISSVILEKKLNNKKAKKGNFFINAIKSKKSVNVGSYGNKIKFYN